MFLNREVLNLEYRNVELTQNGVFNAEGSDEYKDQLIIGGNPTGIANMNTVRHQWANIAFNKMWGQFWLPQVVDMTEDRRTRENLTPDELQAVEDTLGFLIYLDSHQVANLPNISDYITAPMVKACITVQTAFETIHTQAYQYMAEALFPENKREAIYNRWKDNPAMKERIEMIAKVADDFKDNPCLDTFYKVLVMNFILEGVFFYQGFNFFDQLAHRNKIIQSAKQIDFIRRDEFSHMGLFINIIKEIGVDKALITTMMKEAVRNEIKWNHNTYGDRLLGVSKKSSEQYGKWLGNDRLGRLGIDPIYPDVENPYQHLELAAKEGGSRENFFETTVTAYDTAGSLSGWDAI